MYAGSTSSYGVMGSSSSGIGVYGESGLSYAGWFDADTHVNGTLTKALGAFKIDHPLDPANQYLQHSFVESPDMKNVYDGVVTLDGDGEAKVALPTYFEALNRDLRYQLTAVSAAAPDLHIKAKLAKGRFVIGGGSAGLEVCWQVTGIRHDPYAEAHPLVVEQPKGAAEKGKYLHPELYGQRRSKAMQKPPEHPARAVQIG